MANASEAKPVVGPLALVLKVGPKILSVLVKVGKALFGSKLVLAAASFAGYSLLLNWRFALALLCALFVPEMGHVLAMVRYGMKVKGMYFLPFMGAAAVYEGAVPSRRAQLVISLMGPLFGFVLALLMYEGYYLTDAPFFAALAGWMALLNLCNLLPINPLDGGKALNALTHSVSSRLGTVSMILGLALGFVLAYALGLSLLWLLIIVGALELLRERASVREERARRRVIASLAVALDLPPDGERISNALLDLRLWTPDLQKRVADSALWSYAGDANPRKPEMAKRLSDVGFEIGSNQTGPQLQYDFLCGRLIGFLRAKDVVPMTRKQAAYGALAYVGLSVALIALLYVTRHVPGADIAFSMFRS